MNRLPKIPHVALTEYFGPWAIHADRFQAIASRFSSIDIRAHLQANEGHELHPGSDSDFFVTDTGIAVIDICGPMMKWASSMSDNCSTVSIRRQISNAIASPGIVAAVLSIDSPGGTVSGQLDLVDAIKNLSSKMPVSAFIEDFAASAAYSAAVSIGVDRIYANQPTALVGGIGTYAVVEDWSEAAGKMGVKIHVVKAGSHKGDGVPGTPVTEEQLADVQRLIDSINETFIDTVAEGRGVSRELVNEWADGRVHPAAVAVEMGLIDGIKSAAEVLEELTNLTKGHPMSFTIAGQSGAAKASTDEPTTTDPSVEDPKTESPVDDEPTVDEPAPEEKPTDDPPPAAAESSLINFMAVFGDGPGAKMFVAKISFADACVAHIKAQDEKIAQLEKGLKQANESEVDPVSVDPAPGERGKQRGGMESNIRMPANGKAN